MNIIGAILGFLEKVVGPFLFWKGGRDSALRDKAEADAKAQKEFARLAADRATDRADLVDKLHRDL